MGPRQRQAGKAWHDKAVVANSRRMKWPAQALKQKQPTDDPTGTGLAVKQPADEIAGTGLAVNSQ